MRIRNIIFRVVGKLGLVKLKPAVFLHLQKTAGTSIVNVARQFYGNGNVISHGDFMSGTDQLAAADKVGQPDPVQSRFGDILFISGHFGYDFTKRFMANRYSFTFLRDPVERVLSAYYYYKKCDPNKFKHYETAQCLPLDEFLGLAFTDPVIKALLWNYQVSQLAVGWSAVDNFALNDSRLLELALQHLDEFSYVGFTETYKKDQDNILKAIGITMPVGNHKSNANPGRPLFDGLPQSSKNLLLELTVLDRQLYETAWAKYNSPNSA
jgi:Sulfotransferase family